MAEFRVKFVKPGDKVKPPRKPTYEEIGLRHQMSQFYALKSTLESLFGHPIYMDLKETTDLLVWRRAAKKLMDAIQYSVRSTILVADAHWFEHIESVLDHGRTRIKGSKTAADLFSNMTATLIEVVFTQIGFMPTRSTSTKTVPLARDYWQMDQFRSVQYVQGSRLRLSPSSNVVRGGPSRSVATAFRCFYLGLCSQSQRCAEPSCVTTLHRQGWGSYLASCAMRCEA